MYVALSLSPTNEKCRANALFAHISPTLHHISKQISSSTSQMIWNEFMKNQPEAFCTNMKPVQIFSKINRD